MSVITTTEGSKLKTEVTASDFEIQSRETELQSRIRSSNAIELVRVGLTALALVAGLAILGLSADALKVYNETHVAPEYLLPLWPADFDVRPTVALVAGASIVVAVNAASLLASKAQMVHLTPFQGLLFRTHSVE